MWLEVGAGLLLLIWCIAHPAHASNVIFNDQQLTYEGLWRVGKSPQACSVISPTVHTSSSTGDFVTFNFTGDAVSVRGPLSTLSTPMTVVIDGTIKPVAPPVTAPDGCGILFSDTNLGQSEHTITMVFAAASGSVQYGISGLTINIPDAVVNPVLPAQSQVTHIPVSTIMGGTSTPNSIPTSTPIATSSNATASAGAATSSGVADSAPQPTPSSSQSTVSTTAFVTKPGMTSTIIGAIVGTIFAMLALLALFLLLRRRIARVTTRKMDQETGFGQGGQVEGVGNGRLDEEPAGVWSMKEKEMSPQFYMGPGPQDKEGSIVNPLPSSLIAAISTPALGTLRHQSIATTYPQSTPSVYTVALPTAFKNPSPVSYEFESKAPSVRSLPQVPLRPTLPPIKIPPNPSILPAVVVSSASHLQPLPGQATATTSDPTTAYSSAATAGEAPKKRGLRVINGSTGNPRRLPEAPQGFI